jgi:nucleoside-diphosphate-sugar epimerase
MRILVTGGKGFVGRHLVHELHRAGHEIIVSDIPRADKTILSEERISAISCDITSRSEVHRTVREAWPDAVVHLAGVSHVVEASKNRENLVDVTVLGTANICRAVSEMKEGTRSILMVSSALVFEGITADHVAVSEETVPKPITAYAYAKLAAESVLMSFASDAVRPYIVRPFNHVGPGQSPSFVCAALASRIARAPKTAEIEVGSLDAKRDFSDVRDIVRAYRLILEKAPKSTLFVLGRGITVSIQDVFNGLVHASGKHITPRINPSLLREHDEAFQYADTSRAQHELDWYCEIPFETTLDDIYRDAVEQIANS